MSYSLNKLNVVSVLDPRVAMKSYKNFAVMKTGSTINYQTITADGDSLSSINFNCNPPNPNTIVSRKVMCRFDFQIDFVGTRANSDGQNLLTGYVGTFGAPRWAPLASITQVLSVNINDTLVTNNVMNLLPIISRCNTTDYDYVKTLSTFPSYTDFYANYSDATNPIGYGNAVNPLANIGVNGFYQGRGGWQVTELPGGTPTTGSIQFSTYEPLFVSPFLPLADEFEGFHGVQTMTVSMVFTNKLERIWSDGGIAMTGNQTNITGATVSLSARPTIDFIYISAGLLQNIPRSLVYDYSPMNDYRTTIDQSFNAFNPALPIAAQGVDNITSSLITFAAIPRRIYIYIRKAVGSLTMKDSDVVCAINSVSIQYDNRQSLFASCKHPEELYQISQYNGLEMSYTQSRRHGGLVFICDVGRDLTLVNDDEATALSIQKQFQVTVNATNLTNQAISAGNMELYVVACLDGLMTIEDNRTILQTSIVSKNDILVAKNAQEFAEYSKPRSFYGGSFMKTLGKVAKTVAKHVAPIHDFAKKHGVVSKALAYSGNPVASQAAKSFGYGLVPDYPNMGSGHTGGAHVGGAMASKGKLHARTVRGM
jgi:hypothetical protein